MESVSECMVRAERRSGQRREIRNKMARRIIRLILLELLLSAVWGIWAKASARAGEKFKNNGS